MAAGFQSGAGLDPYETITGYRVCQAEAQGHPPRDAGAWDCSGPTVPTQPGDVTVTVAYETTCAQGSGRSHDLYLATQLEIDHGSANGGYDTEYVSRSVAFDCDQLVEPEPATRRGVRRRAVRNP